MVVVQLQLQFGRCNWRKQDRPVFESKAKDIGEAIKWWGVAGSTCSSLLHCPAVPLAMQTPKGTGSKGASSCQKMPHLPALSRKFHCLRKVHPPALLMHSFDSTMLCNFLWNHFKHQEHQLG